VRRHPAHLDPLEDVAPSTQQTHRHATPSRAQDPRPLHGRLTPGK
jgi:hypothetical protein